MEVVKCGVLLCPPQDLASEQKTLPISIAGGSVLIIRGGFWDALNSLKPTPSLVTPKNGVLTMGLMFDLMAQISAATEVTRHRTPSNLGVR